MIEGLNMKIVLASGSPRRKELLKQFFSDFVIDQANVTEIDHLNGSSIEQVVQKNALMKAQAVCDKHPNSLVIGADTVVFFQNQLIGKPKNPADAKKILTRFNGKWHLVYTGIALIETNSNKQVIDFEKTKLKFRKVSEKEIDDYVATGEPMDMAGAYASQGKGAFLIEKIEGSKTNVIGLPMEKLKVILAKYLENVPNY